jgi:hypothetical protein
MQLVEGYILSVSLSSLWPAFVGLFARPDFSPWPLFPFLSISFYKALQGLFLLLVKLRSPHIMSHS